MMIKVFGMMFLSLNLAGVAKGAECTDFSGNYAGVCELAYRDFDFKELESPIVSQDFSVSIKQSGCSGLQLIVDSTGPNGGGKYESYFTIGESMTTHGDEYGANYNGSETVQWSPDQQVLILNGKTTYTFPDEPKRLEVEGISKKWSLESGDLKMEELSASAAVGKAKNLFYFATRACKLKRK